MIKRLISVVSLMLNEKTLMGAALAVLGLVCVLLVFKNKQLSQDLIAECTAHVRTQENLLVVQSACALSDIANENLQTLAEACMAREAQSRAALAERAAIMAKAKPRPQSAKEQKEVVDDATRQAAANRLNRPF